MTFNTIILCASAFFIQSIAGRYCSLSAPALSYGCGVVSNNGGTFIVQSVSPIVPSGIATATDLSLAAELALSGTVPFLSAVEFCGQLPTSGAGAVAYGCGDGNVAITQELGNPGGSNAASSAGLALNSLGLNSCGCGSRF